LVKFPINEKEASLRESEEDENDKGFENMLEKFEQMKCNENEQHAMHGSILIRKTVRKIK
jgi:hypothetical protein